MSRSSGLCMPSSSPRSIDRAQEEIRFADSNRPSVCGKFLFVHGEKLYIRGVTYGTFSPDSASGQFPAPEIVDQDFAQMAAAGLNAVRTYTAPPRWLLDVAESHGLFVMVGLPWEQHITFFDDQRTRSIEARLREEVRSCAG